MIHSTNRLFCRLDGLTPAVREQQRVAALKKLGLLEAETVTVFEEAIQGAAHFLEVPICILGLMVDQEVWIKSAVGLSRLGVMNPFASSRKLPRSESFCAYVVDSQQPLRIDDTLNQPVFASSLLVQDYGIRSYLGTPLITSEGQCIGTLAVMDFVPRHFTDRDREFLALSARWCLSEYLQERGSKMRSPDSRNGVQHPCVQEDTQFGLRAGDRGESLSQDICSNFLNGIKLRLLHQLTQNLQAPLTSVIGMASVLRGEVFGSLSAKQKEYLEIIHTSGQQMNLLVEEILKLGIIDETAAPPLNLLSVNIEMLCQQALNSLGQIAKQKQHELRLSIEPGRRLWLLDKEKVRQALYYLVLSVIQSSEAGGDIRIHVSLRSETVNIAVWISYPWLEDGLPQVKYHSLPIPYHSRWSEDPVACVRQLAGLELSSDSPSKKPAAWERLLENGKDFSPSSRTAYPQEVLGLLLSFHLAESHGGKIVVQGSPESGYRYVLMVPKITGED
jgi:signal transduction histidine kinase